MSSSDESSEPTPVSNFHGTTQSRTSSESDSDDFTQNSEGHASPQDKRQATPPQQKHSSSSSSSGDSDDGHPNQPATRQSPSPSQNKTSSRSPVRSSAEASDAEMKSGSKSSEEDVPQHTRFLSNESSDEGEKTEQKERKSKTAASALFGEDMSSSSSEDERSRDKEEDEDEEKPDIKADDIVGPRLYVDPDEDEEDVAPTQIDLEMARCRADLGKEGPLFVKFPNFLSVDTKPFDPETYEEEIEDDEYQNEEGRSRLKLKIENTVRWRLRKDEKGNEVKESNAKIVKWSDGTMSLYLGNEIFDLEKQKHGAEHNHLYIRQGAGLQAQSVFTEKLVFRPFSTDTLTHRKMTLSMADKSNKTQKVKVIADVGANPEKEKQENIRREEERLRAHARRESHQRRIRDRPRVTGLSSGFLEGYESDEGESLAAIKRSYQRGDPRSSYHDHYQQNRYSSDSDEDAEALEKAKRIGDAKIDSDESVSDRESRRPQKAATTKRKIVIDEDDD